MKQLKSNGYGTTYLGYFCGLVLAILIALIPIAIVAYIAHTNPNYNYGEESVWYGIIATLAMYGLGILGLVVLPPLGVYIALQAKHEPEGGRTAFICLALAPALILFGIPALIIPFVARHFTERLAETRQS